MYEVSVQELMIFVVLGFCTGVFTSFYLTRLIEVVHMWRLVKETLVYLLMMCATIVEDVAFLGELKTKQMRDTGLTEEQIKNFKEVDDHTLTNWKDSVILSMVTKAPPNFRAMMPFKTWNQAMNFMNDAFKRD